jgi:cytochrome c-type biogenesis protein CcmH/NrfG
MKNFILSFFAMLIIVGFSLPATANVRVASDSTFSVWSKDDFDELLKTIDELYKQKKYDEALAMCVKAAELRPNDPRPHAFAGFIYYAQLKFKSASESFAKAISLQPDNKRLYMLKARADWMRNEREAALAACRKALELDPAFAEAHLMIGDILKFDEKRRDEAIAAYKAAVKADPRLFAALEGLGDVLVYAKDEKKAEEVYRQAMELDPQKMAGRFPLGRMLVEQGRLKEARELWEGRTTDKEDTFPNFITVLERAEKLKEATDALAKKPNDPATLVAMGNAVMDGDSWVVDDRQEQAIKYFKKALAKKRGFAAAQYGIVKAYIQIADTFESKNKNVDEELAKLRKLDPKLAKEMEEYRKTYSSGLTGLPLKDQ